MQTGFSRRGAIALIIYFLMITGVCAPVAFFAGKARGEGAATAEPRTASPFATVREAPIALPLAPEPPVVATANDDAVAAAPAAPGGAQTGARRAPRNGPLQQAVVRALAEAAGTDAGDGGKAPGDPLSLALAPELFGAGGGGGFGGDGFGGPSGILVPSLPGGVSGPPPGPTDGGTPPFPPPATVPPEGQPPVLTTPLPPAAAMLFAGLMGLGAAARRKAA